MGVAHLALFGRSRIDRCGRAERSARNGRKGIAASILAGRLPVGPDGRPQLSTVLDAWERGHRLLSSYDLYVTLAEKVRRVGLAADGAACFCSYVGEAADARGALAASGIESSTASASRDKSRIKSCSGMESSPDMTFRLTGR